MKNHTKNLFNLSLTFLRIGFILGGCIWLAACASGPSNVAGGTRSPVKATSRPYQINGVWYYPQQHFEYTDVGVASHYGDGDGFHGKPTATAEKFDTNKLTAAHKTLPLPCVVRVTNLENGRSLKLKVNDRGPFVEGRIIDVSRKAAQLLGFYNKGTAKVHVETLVHESLAMNQIPPERAPRVMLASATTGGQERRQTRSRNRFESTPAPRIMVASSNNRRQPGIYPATYNTPSGPISARRIPPLPHPPQIRSTVTTPLTRQPFKSLGPRGTGTIYIHAGTFKRFSSADQFARNLRKAHPSAKVRLTPVSIQRASMFAVKVGPFRSSNEAQVMLKKITRSSPTMRLIRD